MQTAVELHDDPQAQANGYLLPVERADGIDVHAGRQPGAVRRDAADAAPAPDLGQHTEEVLLELGLSWDDLAKYKEAGAIS